MRDTLARALEGAVGHLEVRLRRRWATTVMFRQSRLEVATEYHAFGGVARCLIPGHGWGAVAFSDPDQVVLAVKRATELSRETATTRPIHLAPIPIRQLESAGRLSDDPRDVPLAVKRDLLEGLTAELLKVDRRIVDSRTNYGDTVVETWFATSEGIWSHEVRAETSLGAVALAVDGGSQERTVETIACAGGLDHLGERTDLFRRVAQRTIGRIGARAVSAGRHKVVLDPRATGMVMLHAITNRCRAPTRSVTRDPLALGERVGPPILSVFDDPTVPGQRTSLSMDDEGSPTSKTMLVKEGLVVGHLHTRESAARSNADATGHGLAPALRSVPTTRPTNSGVEAGTTPAADLVKEVRQGLYLSEVTNVVLEGPRIVIVPANARMIRNGELAEVVRCGAVSAELTSLLSKLEALGDDFSWDPCPPVHQENAPLRPVGAGGPHSRFADLEVESP